MSLWTPLLDRSPRSLRELRAVAARPDFWLGAACAAVVLWAAAQLLVFSFGRDQSIYAVVGRGIVEGEMPYRDRWDFKPPGIFLVYALSEAVFGSKMWGPRLLEALGLLATAGLLVRLSQVFFADNRPGFLAAAIACLVHVQFDFWHTGQPESFGGFLTMAGVMAVSVTSSTRRRALLRWVICGACFGAAALMKPPLGGGAVVCAAFLWRQRLNAGATPRSALGPVFVIGAGCLLPLGAVAFWFWLTGAWADLSWTLFEFTPGYTKLGWGDNAAAGFYRALEGAFIEHSALLGIGAVAAVFGSPLSSRDREGLSLVLGVLALHLAGIAMQAKFFQYHFVASLPLIAWVAGLGWFKLWRAATQRQAGGAVAFASLFAVVAAARIPTYDVPHGFWSRAWERTKYLVGQSDLHDRSALDEHLHYVADFNLSANRRVAERVRALTRPEDAIYVWGFEPAIYWFAERKLASRFIYNVPQRASWERHHAREQLLAELDRSEPTMFVVQHHDVFRFVTGNDQDSKHALSDFPELHERLNQRYQWVDRIEDFELFVLNTRTSDVQVARPGDEGPRTPTATVADRGRNSCAPANPPYATCL